MDLADRRAQQISRLEPVRIAHGEGTQAIFSARGIVAEHEKIFDYGESEGAKEGAAVVDIRLRRETSARDAVADSATISGEGEHGGESLREVVLDNFFE